jgi:hypothetical protein
MNPMDELPIILVCATRHSREQFLSGTATGRSMKAFIEVSKVELRLYPDNAVGLGRLYNQAIEETVHRPAILAFVHDDVLIADFFWADRIRQ